MPFKSAIEVFLARVSRTGTIDQSFCGVMSICLYRWIAYRRPV